MVLKECERCILYGPGGKILMKGRVEVAGESIMLYFEKVINTMKNNETHGRHPVSIIIGT